MFILTTLKDNVRVEPEDLGRPTAEAVSACLERTFINKVFLSPYWVL
jgi:DNA-directed RNA polymerase subunit E'/Rpb7